MAMLAVQTAKDYRGYGAMPLPSLSTLWTKLNSEKPTVDNRQPNVPVDEASDAYEAANLIFLESSISQDTGVQEQSQCQVSLDRSSASPPALPGLIT